MYLWILETLRLHSFLFRHRHESDRRSTTSSPRSSLLNTKGSLNMQAVLRRDTHSSSECSSETWHIQLITQRCFVTPMLTRGIAAVVNSSVFFFFFPVLLLPLGTARELMRCQQRCHVFIHSISPKVEKSACPHPPTRRIWFNITAWIFSVSLGLTQGASSVKMFPACVLLWHIEEKKKIWGAHLGCQSRN